MHSSECSHCVCVQRSTEIYHLAAEPPEPSQLSDQPQPIQPPALLVCGLILPENARKSRKIPKIVMLLDHRSVQFDLLLLFAIRRFVWRRRSLACSSSRLSTVDINQNSLCIARLCFESKTNRGRYANKAGVEASPCASCKRNATSAANAQAVWGYHKNGNPH